MDNIYIFIAVVGFVAGALMIYWGLLPEEYEE